jgi:hypothetical protein
MTCSRAVHRQAKGWDDPKEPNLRKLRAQLKEIGVRLAAPGRSFGRSEASQKRRRCLVYGKGSPALLSMSKRNRPKQGWVINVYYGAPCTMGAGPAHRHRKKPLRSKLHRRGACHARSPSGSQNLAPQMVRARSRVVRSPIRTRASQVVAPNARIPGLILEIPAWCADRRRPVHQPCSASKVSLTVGDSPRTAYNLCT